MPAPSPAIAAVIRAMHGESDLVALMPALADAGLARIIACAPGVHPCVGAVAALCGGLPSLLDAPTRADPALHGAMARLIGTPAGRAALRTWAEVAPAGWGAAHAEALITAVHAAMVDASVAAALIGPGDDAAVLLHTASDAAFAIRRWGQANHAAPDAWSTALAPAERDRLITALRRDGSHGASCLPWLPPDAVRAADVDVPVGDALDAFAAASPSSRSLHAARMQRLVDRARPSHLAALTRLACAMDANAVWRRVQTLIRVSPGDAWRVVAAAPWDALPENVRAAILERADASDVCAAIAAAQGEKGAKRITHETAAAFFAALAPAVWDALDADAQRRWRHALWGGEAHLAVRSLGLRPEVLARAPLNNLLARAAQRHARDAAALCAALLPVALRHLPPVDAHVVIAAMPSPPPDPDAFFSIASGRGEPGLASAPVALRTPDDLALAVTLQRCAGADARMPHDCTVLQDALRGRSYDDLMPFMPLLDADARAALMFEADALIVRLAYPERQDALRRTLTRLAALPSEVAIPTYVALHRRTTRRAYYDAGNALATTLHAHGDEFLELADAITNDDLRTELLPLPKDAALADALRAMMRDDPVDGRTLACALRDHAWRKAIAPLLRAPPQRAMDVWQTLDAAAQRRIVSVLAAASPESDPLALHDPIAALALAAMRSSDADLHDACVTAFAARSGHVRAIWGRLPPKVQQMLGNLPAFADLPTQAARPVIRRRIRRGRAGSSAPDGGSQSA